MVCGCTCRLIGTHLTYATVWKDPNICYSIFFTLVKACCVYRASLICTETIKQRITSVERPECTSHNLVNIRSSDLMIEKEIKDQSLRACCAAMLLSKLESAATLHLRLHAPSCSVLMQSGRAHIPAGRPRSDTLETIRQERHICLLDPFLEQTQLFRLTLQLLCFHVHTHNACSQSPKRVKKKGKKKLPFFLQPFAVCSSDP